MRTIFLILVAVFPLSTRLYAKSAGFSAPASAPVNSFGKAAAAKTARVRPDTSGVHFPSIKSVLSDSSAPAASPQTEGDNAEVTYTLPGWHNIKRYDPSTSGASDWSPSVSAPVRPNYGDYSSSRGVRTTNYSNDAMNDPYARELINEEALQNYVNSPYAR